MPALCHGHSDRPDSGDMGSNPHLAMETYRGKAVVEPLLKYLTYYENTVRVARSQMQLDST